MPVFYDVEMFGENARYLLRNPIAPVLEGFASITRHQHPDARWLIYGCTVAALTAWAAYVVFKRTEPAFAESL